MTRITCRVCETSAPATDAAILLCDLCRADLNATARRIADRYATVLARWMREYDAFQALSKDSDWWQKVQDAKYRDDPNFAVAWERARTGSHATLVHAYDALVVTSNETWRVGEWYSRAAAELEAARAVDVEQVVLL